MVSTSTQVSIADGERIALAFGTRFDVRYGKADTVLRDVLLDSRAANGDLVFLVERDDATTGGRVRVRPSTIDAIVGSGVDHPVQARQAIEDVDPTEEELEARVRLADSLAAELGHDPDLVAAAVEAELPSKRPTSRQAGETARAYLDRAERTFGAGYTAWLGSDLGQVAIANAQEEDRAARKVRLTPVTAAEYGSEAILSGRKVPVARLGHRHTTDPRRASYDPARDPNLGCVECIARENRADVPDQKVGETSSEHRARVRESVRRDAIVANTNDPDKIRTTAKGRAKLEAAAAPARTAKPYSERNQGWKCGTCKRRTRAAFCENGHQRVEAPAGKRRDAR